MPKLFNLRTDPYERADITSNTYYDWMMRSGILVLAAGVHAVRRDPTDHHPRSTAQSDRTSGRVLLQRPHRPVAPTDRRPADHPPDPVGSGHGDRAGCAAANRVLTLFSRDTG
jgi:hypothetical protein